MFQTGTDKALDDQVQRPRPVVPQTNAFSFAQFAKAPAKGIGAAFSEGIAFGSEVSGAFGQVLGATGTDSGSGMFSVQSEQERKQSDAARQKLLTTGIDYSNEAGDLFRARAKEIMPDPETAHASENVAAGLFKFGTKAVGYTLTGGIIPGAAMLGFDEGLTEADRLKQQGVDIETRTQAGAVAGGVAGVSVLVPMTGATMATRFVKGVAIGEGTMIGQAFAEKAILENAGYDKIANTFDPFDPVSLAVGLVPGMLGAKFGRPAAKRLDAVKTEADVRSAAALSPDEAAASAAFERSAANLRELEAAVKAEKDPGKRLLLVDELEKQRTAARDNFVKDQMRADPDLEPAARVRQVVDAMDASRLTPDTDLRGMSLHKEAIETAHEQIARGEPVAVELPIAEIPPSVRVNRDSAGLPKDFAILGPAGREVGYGFLTNKPEGVQVGATAIIEASDRGKGYASAAYEQMAREILADGRPLVSDQKVSTDAQRVYESLSKKGFTVERDPSAALQPDGALASPNGPVYRVTEAPAKDTGPARTAAAAAELHAARELAQNPPHVERTVPGRDPAEVAGDVDGRGAADRPAAGPSEPPAAPSAGRSSEAAPGAAAVNRAAVEVAALDPDMLVMLDGMDQPARIGDLMARVKEEAAQDAKTARLVEVAAECALSA